ncbi:Long-chain-fatty-acid--CoA ligase [Labrenzia sp. THAF191b]|uniref:malonate--CoA ligase n=1 Tax=unclassified Labrenzia TaxID=2648686 RepID=UPI0012691032|nr:MULTISPECIES: malonyl-CoA synthase [unclassified Labrenzia]QFT00962.1 Long-chain-fatty-acid--CoA ligase [Labrenzia sp. THAF191b]QFT07275.1 Long-chain-fatty-acid--CoA ligase [Labrenzia sp. THAF191a]QFT18819.1 Long-chain-fatty-acid--CoA ligase [Labrenzia sp. THAF187b]
MMNHLFDALTAFIPDRSKVFLETLDGGQITYADMFARSAQYAGALQKLGVKAGDRVAVQVEKTPDALMLYLGTIRAGGVFLPLNTAYTPAEIGYFVGDAEPAVFVCDPARADVLAGTAQKAGARLHTLDQNGEGSLSLLADQMPTDYDNRPREDDDLAAILYTSGTTGRSKGAMLTHGNLTSNSQTMVKYWQFTEDDVLLHALPIFHTHGLFVATNCLMMAGGSMLFLSKFDLDQVLAVLPKATAMMGVPTFYTRLLASDRFTRDVAAHMRLFISGSAPLSAEVHKEFRERTGHAILERYGMTETNMNTSNPYDGARRPGTVGFPLPGVGFRVVDARTGRELPDGEVGIIEIKGPNVFLGYWRMPEKTAQEFRADGYFITGDMGRIDEDGYVSIVGRSKDLIISGGFNVYPAEVEALLDELPGVAESAVIGVPHPDFGEAVVAVLAPKPGAELGQDAVQASLNDRLAKFKQPKKVHVLEALPRNTMGKIQKNVLRERFSGDFG